MTRLKELRLGRGYTQIKMQHLTGIDQSDYSKIENGKIVLTGTGKELAESEMVKKAYLGG